MKTTRRRLIKSAFFGGCGLQALPSAALAENMDANLREYYDGTDSLKKSRFAPSKWWKFTFQQHTFSVCLEEFPAWGRPREVVHAWMQLEDGRIELVWLFRASGIGPLEVLIDESKANITVKALGNTNFKDSIIATVRLDAVIQ